MFGPLTKRQFILTAEPFMLVQQLPREFTLRMQLSFDKWITSAVRMNEFDVRMYDIRQRLCNLEEQNNEHNNKQVLSII